MSDATANPNADRLVVVVDDCQDNLDLLGRQLAGAGYRNLRLFPDPLRVQEALAAGPAPDLFLLDIMMPELDGISLCRALRTNERFAGSSVIFITACHDDETLHRAFTAGAQDFLRKPYSRVELLCRLGSILTQQDLTRRLAQAEARTRDANQRLREANQMLNNFAHTVAHDLKSPLATMLSALDMVAAADVADPETGRRGLAMCQRSGQRMLRLISDILVCAEQAGGPPDVELVHLDALLAEVVEDLAAPLREKDGRVEVGPLPAVTGSRTHLRRVFQNLVANSVKYARPGVPPLVRIAAQEVARKETATGLRVCRITVEDNGVGFSDAEAALLFKPFQRLRNVPAEGAGIGLAAVKSIVAAHCGSITAQGTPGQGARFTITLPLDLKPDAGSLIRRELRFSCRKERRIDSILLGQTGAVHRFTVTDESEGGLACESLPFERLQPGILLRLDDGLLYEVRWVREGDDGLVHFGMMKRG